MQTRKLLPALALAILLALAAVVWFYPPTGDFKAGNPFWNGLSTYSSQTHAIAINSYADLPASPQGTAFIVVPYESFTAAQIADLNSYVQDGGTLILMDDYGCGNQVLSGLGLNLRFTGQPLLDPLFNYRNQWLPQISDFNGSALAANAGSIILNHATCLNNTAGATVFAESSSFSFLDVNENGVYDSGEPTGPLPFAAYVQLGQGYVVAVADPSIMINSMIGMDGNSQFMSDIVGIGGSNSQVYVDQLHLPQTSLDSAKAFLSSVYGVAASTLGTLTLIVVLLAYSLKPIWSNRREQKNEQENR